MFGRRIKLNLIQRIRQSVWPDMGWDRTWHYYRHRMLRHSATPAEIASGLAIGAGLSFTPLLGTHFAQAIFFAWVFRANILSGFLGTIVGNPWTFPAMFWLSYKVGEAVFAALGFGHLIDMPDTMTLEYLLANPLKLLVPMTIGGYVCAVVSWPVFYTLMYYPVKAMHKTYHHQKTQRILKRQYDRTVKMGDPS